MPLASCRSPCPSGQCLFLLLHLHLLHLFLLPLPPLCSLVSFCLLIEFDHVSSSENVCPSTLRWLANSFSCMSAKMLLSRPKFVHRPTPSSPRSTLIDDPKDNSPRKLITTSIIIGTSVCNLSLIKHTHTHVQFLKSLSTIEKIVNVPEY